MQSDVIISESRVMIEYDEDGTTMLKISDVTPSDDGLYKCVAINDAGLTSTSCVLTVIGKFTCTLRKLHGKYMYKTCNTYSSKCATFCRLGRV